MNRCLVLFVEGDTELEFYKRVISNAKEKKKDKKFNLHIECKNVNGVGGFKNIALRKFEKDIKVRYGDKCQYTVVLCSDTDVFELEQKPPVDWEEVKEAFEKKGVAKVIMVRAKLSIEDWFLHDFESIVSYLRLNKKIKITGTNGYDKLKKLYRKANKIYYKGMRSNKLIEQLDIEKIVEVVGEELAPLYEALGIENKAQKRNNYG